MAKGLVTGQNMKSAQEPLTEPGQELDTVDIGKQLERVKWFLWHGDVARALNTIEDIEDELDLLPQNGESRKKLLKVVREFRGYIEANQNFIPNYGDRYRHGEKISNGLRGVRGESSGEQTHGQEAANAMECVRRTQPPPGADKGPQWRTPGDLHSLVSGNAKRTGDANSQESRIAPGLKCSLITARTSGNDAGRCGIRITCLSVLRTARFQNAADPIKVGISDTIFLQLIEIVQNNLLPCFLRIRFNLLTDILAVNPVRLCGPAEE